VQKRTETEHLLSTVDQCLTADEEGPISPGPDVTAVTDPDKTDENCPQVVTTQLPVSPKHTEEAEVADITVASSEPATSLPGPDWINTKPNNREPFSLADAMIRNRLQGK